MSPVETVLFGPSLAQLGVGHNSKLTLRPMNEDVQGYADNPNDSKLPAVLRSAVRHLESTGVEITDIFRIPRTELAGITIKDITGIEANGSLYRVKQYRNDPATEPVVDFMCAIA